MQAAIAAWRNYFLAGFGLTYTFGFLIWSIHANLIGAPPLSLIDKNYVLSGVPVALLIVLLWYIAHIASIVFEGFEKKFSHQTILVSDTIILSIFVLLPIVLVTLLIYTISENVRAYRFETAKGITNFAVLYIILILLIICSARFMYAEKFPVGYYSKLLFHRYRRANKEPALRMGDKVGARLSYKIMFVSLGIIFCFYTIQAYSAYVFPLIPQTLGGGRAMCGRVIVKDPESLKAHVLSTGDFSGDIVFSGDDTILVDLVGHEKRIIQLSREMIREIQWCSEN